MKAMLLRVGIDKGTDQALGPIFNNKEFEFVPISDSWSKIKPSMTYRNTIGRSRKPFSTFLPKSIADRHLHNDPEFKTFTYGDDTCKRDYFHNIKEPGDKDLKSGDFLIFYAGLTPYEAPDQKEGLYIVGYFEIEEVVDFRENIPENELIEYKEKFQNNPHKLIPENNEPVIVKGKESGKGEEPKSELLNKAILISEDGLDSARKKLLIASKEIEPWIERLGPKKSLQRSVPPRFIRSEYVEQFMDRLRKKKSLSPGPHS
jgi:hypothetical protein